MTVQQLDQSASSGALTRAGVGYSENPASRQAGAEATLDALAQAGTNAPDLLLLFATARHDPGALLEGVRNVCGPRTRIIGGAATGVLTNDRLGYEGYQCGVAVLDSGSSHFRTFMVPGVDRDEYRAGQELGSSIGAVALERDSCLLFMYDMVKRSTDSGSIFNLATPLIRGMSDTLPEWPAVAGLGMIGDFQFNPTHQFFDDAVLQQSALALLITGELRMDTVTVHGCRPSSGYRMITRADGNVVLELDGRPAVDVVQELVGEGGADWESWPIFLTLGVNRGEKFGDYREDDYAIRLCMAVDRERGGLVMFGDDLQAGTEIQIMRRSINFDYIGERVGSLLERSAGRRPVLALYIDCSGRASAFSGTEREDADEVRLAIGDRVPLLGMYSGAEITKVGDEVQANNWTGVLCLFSEQS